MVKIKIIRHADRFDYSHPLLWLGYFGHYWADAPLTWDGYKNADAKGKQLFMDSFDPKKIYSSPYSRTMATATELKKSFSNSELVIEPLLSEFQWWRKHTVNLYPGGIPTTYDGKATEFSYPETAEQFSKRVQFIISKLMEKNDNDFLVVTHGELLKKYISYLQDQYPDIVLDPGTTPYLTVLSFEYDHETQKIIKETIKLE